MKLLCVGKKIEFSSLDIDLIHISQIETITSIKEYSYIIISGGDGSIRRVLKSFYLKFDSQTLPPFVINPIGSFNVIAKWHRLPKVDKVLEKIAKNEKIDKIISPFYAIDDKKIFLFSAGNGTDVAHIFISEVLRFGVLESGFLRYLVSILFLLPFHIIAGFFILFSKKRFFIFTPLKFKKFLNIYGRVDEPIEIHLDNHYNVLQFDGDLSVIKKPKIVIKKVGEVAFVTL